MDVVVLNDCVLDGVEFDPRAIVAVSLDSVDNVTVHPWCCQILEPHAVVVVSCGDVSADDFAIRQLQTWGQGRLIWTFEIDTRCVPVLWLHREANKPNV